MGGDLFTDVPQMPGFPGVAGDVLLALGVANDEPKLVRADSYTAKQDITNYLIGVLFLLILLEILIVRQRGEL